MVRVRTRLSRSKSRSRQSRVKPYFSPLDVEMIDQLSNLEVLCPRFQWTVRRQFRQRKSITV